MQFITIDATWETEIVLPEELLTKVEGKKVGLFASVNFLNLDNVKKQLKERNCEVITTKAKRTHKEGQILGCDAYHDSYENPIIEQADELLYIGDGMFHPKALLLAGAQHVLIWDPVNEEVKEITQKDVEKQKKRKKANLMKYHQANTVGILVTTKPGQQYYKAGLQLKKTLEEEGKKAYVFIDDTFDFSTIENYPFIDAWVNTACPRIGTDDIVHIPKPVVNLKDV